MMFNACLFEIISYLTLRSSRVGSGIAQRREGHLSFAVSHKRCYVWCCAGHIEVYRSGIFQLHSIVDFSFSCWIERDFWYLSRIGLPTNLENVYLFIYLSIYLYLCVLNLGLANTGWRSSQSPRIILARNRNNNAQKFLSFIRGSRTLILQLGGVKP